jgi:enoyl-[acyl-carrier protein] reductase II
MNGVSKPFQIKYSIIQTGMVWCSGWKLSSAVSNAGGLGVIGAGYMYPDISKLHIQKTKLHTTIILGLICHFIPNIEQHIETIINEKVSIVITSAGNPNNWTTILKADGIKVLHLIANTKFALKAIEAGVDALIAEGFEAGGHNGKEETTTLCLISKIVEIATVPVITSGGIASGKSKLAVFALGAEAIQIGSRFVASEELSAHVDFK